MILTIITFFVILSILVLIHEFGHFIVAKKLGIKVEEFSLGLPLGEKKPLLAKKIGETVYSVHWLPIGGFVRLLGEDAEVQSSKFKDQRGLERYFYARPQWQRVAVLVAGVAMNFFLAVVIISYIFTQGVFVPSNQVHIETVTENSPAATAGLKNQDIIVSFAGKPVSTTEDLINIAKAQGGVETPLVIRRDGQEVTLSVVPRKDPPEGEGPLGISISNLEEKKYPWYQAPFYGLREAFQLSWLMLTTLATMVFKLITFQKAQVDVAGPVGIAQATGQAIKYGYMAVLQLMGLLSLNLALFNILPIPALDGGRLFFVLTEKWLGRHIKPKVEAVVHQIGMAFLLGLVVLITINDLVRLFTHKG